jgi:Sugar phosphate isomerases/epimerases
LCELPGYYYGEGQIDIKAIINFLRVTGYDGYISVEFEGTGDPVYGTLKSIGCIKSILT